MGIKGGQFDDGTIPEAKLDSATQTKLNTGGGAPSAVEARTTDGAVASADSGKVLSNTGAGTSPVLLTADSGLSDGFEISLLRTDSGTFAFLPDTAETVVLPTSVEGTTGQGVRTVNSNPTANFTMKKVGTRWYQLSGGTIAFLPVQLLVANLATTTGIQNVDTLSFSSSTSWTFLLREDGGGAASLGSQDQTGTYTDGVALGSPSSVYLEITNNDGANNFEWGGVGPNPGTVDLNVGNLADWNYSGLGRIIEPTNVGIMVDPSTTNTYWIDTDGNLYIRNQGAGPVTDFYTAIISGPL